MRSIDDKKAGRHVPLVFFLLLSTGIWFILLPGYFINGIFMLMFSILFVGRVWLKLNNHPKSANYLLIVYGILINVFVWFVIF